MPRRKSKKPMKRLNEWKAKQQIKDRVDKHELHIRGQKPAVEQVLEVRGEDLANEQELEVRGEDLANEQVLEVRGEEPVDEQPLEVRLEDPAGRQELEVRGEEGEEQELEVTGESKVGDFRFKPFTENDQLQLAGQFNLPVEGYLNIEQMDVPLDSKPPINPIKMDGDGNCFYRAISYHICGTEKYHAILRQRTIEYMATLSEDVYRPWFVFEPNGRTMDQYLSRDGRTELNPHPADLRTWATQVEVNAMSSLLGRNIFVYNDKGQLKDYARGTQQMGPPVEKQNLVPDKPHLEEVDKSGPSHPHEITPPEKRSRSWSKSS
ncbi:uncharacterized protein [Branchiostoma lanceolatum]|uniref:uncharacterized protein n=2 Tax=Branchiostoma lanceolatum TaxID=7740 RepID=UPI003453EFB6